MLAHWPRRPYRQSFRFVTTLGGKRAVALEEFPFTSAEWDPLKGIAESVLNADAADDDGLTASLRLDMVELLDGLRVRYGDHPVLLMRKAIYGNMREPGRVTQSVLMSIYHTLKQPSKSPCPRPPPPAAPTPKPEASHPTCFGRAANISLSDVTLETVPCIRCS